MSEPFVRIGGVLEPREVNGQPGALLRERDGRVVSAWVLDIGDGRVRLLRSVLNPDKLRHLGLVADAWAVRRAARDARLS